MLMENTCQLKDPDNLSHIFDLKGSSVDRKTKGLTKPSTTLKDENFLLCCEYANKHNRKFVQFERYESRNLTRAIRKDVEFLRNQGLMDYSLLLCIEKVSNS